MEIISFYIILLGCRVWCFRLGYRSISTKTIENILVNLADWLYRETGYDKLAYAGGVALNCVANSKIARYTAYNEIAIQPAAGDAGCALGAAALISRPLMQTPFLGYESTNYVSAEEAARRIIDGEIVAVIQGRAEFGPRALGNRSWLMHSYTS